MLGLKLNHVSKRGYSWPISLRTKMDSTHHNDVRWAHGFSNNRQLDCLFIILLTVLLVCFITKHFVTYSFFAYTWFYQPYVWFSDCFNCSHWRFEVAVLHMHVSSIYHSMDLLEFISQCSPRYWHLDSNYCRSRCRQSLQRFVLSPLLLLLLHLLGMLWSDIQFFTLTRS